jgi:hypothetical protein
VHDFGDQIPLSIAVRDGSGVLVNPVAVTLTITKPDGSVITPVVPMPPTTTGRPLYIHTADAVGRHVWRMETATPAGAHSGVFTVRTNAPRWIISLDEARAQLNVTGTSGDLELEEYLQVTTDIVENIVGPVVNVPVTEEIHDGGVAILLNRVPVVSIVSVENLADATVTYGASDYLLNKQSGVLRRYGATSFVGPVKVSYIAGRSNLTPDAAIMAAKVIIQHLFRSQQLRPSGPPAPGSDAVATVPMMGFAVPNAAVQMLMPHSRRRAWLAG